jgi:drug/metabolite transporter (DMT)-like permease
VTWLLLAGGAAFFYALHGAWSKRVAGLVGPLVAAWALFAFALPFLGIYLAVQGIPDPGPRFWPVLAVNCLLNLAAAWLFVSALNAGDLGITYPLLTLTPLFVVPVEFLLLGELPGPWGGVGILLVVLGIYLLNYSQRHLGLLAPVAALARAPAARRSLAVALIWSVSGTLDRVAVLESSAAFYGTALAAGLSVLFLPLIWLVRLRRGRGARSPSRVESHGPAAGAGWMGTGAGGRGTGPGAVALVLVIHGALVAAMLIVQMEALELALASYVLSIKRTGAILAVILGWIAFREVREGSRLLGTAVAVAGVAVLAIWG